MSTGFAFIQFYSSGHRFHYIRTLVEACDPDTAPSLLTTREAVASREFNIHLAELASRGALKVTVIGSSQEPTRRLVASALRVSADARHLRIIVAEADRLLWWLFCASLRYRRSQLPEIRLLIMRTPEPSMRLRRANVVACAKIALSHILRHWWPRARAYFLTDAFGVVIARRGYDWAQPIRDPAGRLPLMDRLDARSQLGVSADAYVLGLLGVVSASKHPRLALDALRHLPPRVMVLFAGHTDEETGQAIEAAQRLPATAGRVMWIDGYLTDADLGKSVSACDAVMLLYELDAPSGMLATAVHAGIPIIAGGSRWVTRVVEKLDAGVTTQLDGESVVRTVTSLMSAPPRPRRVCYSPHESAVQDFAGALVGA